jgi:glycosyltransferase involved in cell wall biosynthesis
MVAVSVCMITYGHEKFIGQAIESVLMQQTNFAIELLIANDHSLDNTDQQIRHYIATHPKGHLIKYILREKNWQMMPNFINALQQCSGKYIALCEGDDYWTDPNKLQRQYDYIEQHPDIALVAHNFHILTQQQQIVLANTHPPHQEILQISPQDFALRPFFQTASFFFRKTPTIEQLPKWYANVLAGDYFLVLFLAQHGNIAYMTTPMSVYRKNPQSVSHTTKFLTVKDNFVQHLKLFNQTNANAPLRTALQTNILLWELKAKPYETDTYAQKIIFFMRHFACYFRHFYAIGHFKLAIKYLFSPWFAKAQ